MFNSVIGPKVAPVGTVTVKLVVLATVTVALVAPKNTILLAAEILKLVPVMVIVVPAAPLIGVKELIVGWAIVVIAIVKSEITTTMRLKRFFISCFG